MPIPRKLQSYCEEFSTRMMEQSFPKEGSITGPEILDFCPIKQVNFFIIKNLLVAWKRDVEKMKSPYFDNTHDEVQGALENYANILSRHIKIDMNDFSGLLNQSVKEAISLMTTPYEFYMAFADEAREKKYSEGELNDIGKYIKHNKFIYTDFLNKAVQSEMKTGNYRSIMETVFNETSESPEDPTTHIDSFNKILPLEPEILLETMESTSTGSENSSFEELPENADNSNVDKSILHDSLREESVKSLADMHEEKKNQDIRNSLNLNQRFMFINGLFEGDEEKFNQTIDKLESLNTIDDARQYLVDELKWDEAQEDVGEFLELISKRLA